MHQLEVDSVRCPRDVRLEAPLDPVQDHPLARDLSLVQQEARAGVEVEAEVQVDKAH